MTSLERSAEDAQVWEILRKMQSYLILTSLEVGCDLPDAAWLARMQSATLFLFGRKRWEDVSPGVRQWAELEPADAGLFGGAGVWSWGVTSLELLAFMPRSVIAGGFLKVYADLAVKDWLDLDEWGVLDVAEPGVDVRGGLCARLWNEYRLYVKDMERDGIVVPALEVLL